jgi:hypothetical protein
MDARKIELMFAWLPEEPWPWLKQMIIVTHRDHPRLLHDISQSVTECGKGWPVRVRTDIQEREAIRTFDLPPPLETFFEHSLGVKILQPLVTPPPLLFTDDDIIITRDPATLLLNTWGFASHSGLDGYTDTAKDHEGLQAINDTFELTLTLDEYNAGRSDEAVWYIPRIDLGDYVRRLQRFYLHPHLVRISQDSGTAPFNHTQRFRKSGMRYFSGFVINSRMTLLQGRDYRALPYKVVPKKVPNATFVHYCASGNKPAYMEWLWKNVPS